MRHFSLPCWYMDDVKKVALQSESCHSNHWNLASDVDGSWCHVRRGSSMLVDISKQFERFYCSKYYGLTSWCMQFWSWSSLLSLTYYKQIFWKHNKGEQVSIAPVASCSPLSSHPSNDWGTQPCGQTLLGSIYHLQQWQKTSLLHSISILGLLRERRPASAKFCARTAGSSLHLPRNQKMGGL